MSGVTGVVDVGIRRMRDSRRAGPWPLQAWPAPVRAGEGHTLVGHVVQALQQLTDYGLSVLLLCWVLTGERETVDGSRLAAILG